MTELPHGWAWATVEDLGAGTANALAIGPFGSNLKVADYRASGVPLIFVRHIRAREFDGLDPKFIDERKAEDLSAHLVRPGDVVVTKMGEPPGDATVYRGPSTAVITADCIKVTPQADVSASYLAYLIEAPQFRAAMRAITQGVAQKKVSLGRFRKLPIPVAPAAEQQRIVAAIEENLSRLDAAERTALSATRRIRALERSIITEASATLDPPRHWQVITVADAGEVKLGLQRSPKRHSGLRMRPYLRVANVFEDRIDGNDVMSMDISDAEWERFRLRDGDVLLNEGQSPQFLGRPAVYRGDPADVAFTNSLIRFQANENVDPEWALLVFRSHMHNRRFMRESQITTNIAHLAAGRFKTVEFPLPPLEEQHSRVAVARARLDVCARLRGEAEVSLKRAGSLRRSILAAAFSGELVSQNPEDEPALVLLERLRAERDGASSTPKRRARS